MKTVQSYPILAPIKHVCVAKALNAPVKHRIPARTEHVNVVLTWNASGQCVFQEFAKVALFLN